jgi:hypothetical protein
VAAKETPQRILTRHFLRRFLENDLVAPDADRSQTLALVGAGCFCTTLFITVAVSCFKYVIGTHTPGQAAIASLDDKFFYLGLSMLVAALVAVSQWDALVVDGRDASILEPLPLRISTIRRAKLAAIAILGLSTAVIVNLAPTVLFPMLLVVKQRVRLIDALFIVLVHAVVTMAAAVFGFVAVVASRDGLSVVLGPRLFARVSPLVQGVLVMVLGSALLLLPGAATRVERRALAVSTTLSPPAWFLGVYEVAAGSVVVNARRGPLVARLEAADRVATARYHAHRAQFQQLAGTALAGLAYAWNSRRLPQLAPIPIRETRRRSRLSGLAALVTGRDAAVRAGFHFARAALWRSRTHRLTLAGAAAVGLAMAIIALSRVDLPEAMQSGRAVTRLLVIQPLLYGALLVGFRHAIRVPAELRANWGFQMAWQGQTRRCLAGARRAAIVALVLPALIVVFPLIALVTGPVPALLHALVGFAGALVVLEALLAGYDKVPFTCTYVPDENMKALGPLYVLVFLIGAASFARIEGRVIDSAAEAAIFVGVLLALAIGLRLASTWRPAPGPIQFDESPEGTQQLGLHT